MEFYHCLSKMFTLIRSLLYNILRFLFNAVFSAAPIDTASSSEKGYCLIPETDKAFFPEKEGAFTSQNDVNPLDLNESLLKLRKLDNPPANSATTPAQVFQMYDLMEKNENANLLLFVNLQGEPQPDPVNNQYVTEIMLESDVITLGRDPSSAELVASVLTQYPDLADMRSQELHPTSLIARFRAKCSWVDFGNKQVYNVSGSTGDRRVNTCVAYWRWRWKVAVGGGYVHGCRIELRNGDTHSAPQLFPVGGHMELRQFDNMWYILPICYSHNKSGKHERGTLNYLTTQATAKAVKIPRW